jgi:hypothetical protein
MASKSRSRARWSGTSRATCCAWRASIASASRSGDFRIYAQDLPSGWDIAGLVGLSFLRRFNYEVRSVEGRILVERAAGAAA